MTTLNAENSASPAAQFDPVASARGLLRSARRAGLSTIDARTGAPYVSLVALATDRDGAPLLLVSDLARHTANLKADPRASVLCAEVGSGDPLSHPRVTLIGRCVRVEKEAHRGRWLARQPDSAGYFDFSDFNMLRLEPSGAHLVAGFGRIVDLGWDELKTDLDRADGLFEAEPGIVAHMNEDHRDATRLYATALLGAPDGDWTFEGCDPLGCEIGLDGRALYLPFPDRALNAGDVRKALVRLVGDARAKVGAAAG